MLRRLALLSILCFASTSLLWAQGAKRAGGACRQIAAACRNAGFVPGGRSTGNGLQGDCVAPIMQGKPQRPKATKPLPQVDPETVAACKAENPDFGQGKNASAAGGGETAPSAPPPATQPREGAPNIVVVLTDDLSLNLVQYMPHVLAMQKDGVTFANYFVTDSLCCPSRSSIFTGRFPHDTGVFKNAGSDGGYLVFRSRGNESSTYATALYAAGYRTAMLGKYLNGYEPNRQRLSRVQLRAQPGRQGRPLRPRSRRLPDRRDLRRRAAVHPPVQGQAFRHRGGHLRAPRALHARPA
jgi:hypothetical protein